MVPLKGRFRDGKLLVGNLRLNYQWHDLDLKILKVYSVTRDVRAARDAPACYPGRTNRLWLLCTDQLLLSARTKIPSWMEARILASSLSKFKFPESSCAVTSQFYPWQSPVPLPAGSRATQTDSETSEGTTASVTHRPWNGTRIPESGGGSPGSQMTKYWQPFHPRRRRESYIFRTIK